MVQDFLNTFALALVAIDPISLLPIFAGLTANLTKQQQMALVIKTMVVSTLVLMAFWLLGTRMLAVLGVSLASFRIVGGLFLLAIAAEMVFEKRNKRREKTIEDDNNSADIASLAVFPISMPLIAGPAAITMVMLIPQNVSAGFSGEVAGFLAVFLVILIAGVSLWGASYLSKILGPTVTLTLQRIFGIILGALAVEFVISGIKQAFL